MPIKSAQEFFVDELKDIYSAEKQAIRAYPKLAKSTESEELKQALQTHLEETKGQVERLDRVFGILEKRPTGKTCEGMKGVLAESAEALEVEAGPLRDAALIAAAQRAEHYEMAAYGTVIALAKAMGQDEIAGLLSETLEQEKATDQKLTTLSETINRQAIGGEDEEEPEEEGEEDDEEYEDVETEVESEEEERADLGEDAEEEDEPAPAKAAAKKTPAKKTPARKTAKK